jgi:hypothetical protein
MASFGGGNMAFSCFMTCRALDLGVVSYAGAYIERFDKRMFTQEIDCFRVDTSQPLSSPIYSVGMRRRKFACLDTFLGGKKVWVLHLQETGKQNSFERVNSPLFLLT